MLFVDEKHFFDSAVIDKHFNFYATKVLEVQPVVVVWLEDNLCMTSIVTESYEISTVS